MTDRKHEEREDVQQTSQVKIKFCIVLSHHLVLLFVIDNQENLMFNCLLKSYMQQYTTTSHIKQSLADEI